MNTWNKEYVVRLIYSHLKTHKHSPTKGNCCLMYFAPRSTLLPSSVLKKCAIVSRSETNCRYYKCTERLTNFMDNTALQLSGCLFRATGLACHLAFIPGVSLNILIGVWGWETKTLTLYWTIISLTFQPYQVHQKTKTPYPLSLRFAPTKG